MSTELLNTLHDKQPSNQSWYNEVAAAAETPAPAETPTPEPEATPEPVETIENTPLAITAETVKVVAGEDVKHDAEVKIDLEKSVPLKALQEAREEAKEAKRRAQMLEEQMRRFEQQFQQNQQPVEEEPDETQDPIGTITRLKQEQRQIQQALYAQQQEKEILNFASTAAQAFRAEKPDFNDAYNHLLNARANQLRMLGAPNEAVASQLRNEELSLYATARQQGLNPAQVLYEYAKSYGYAPKAAEAPKTAAAPVVDPVKVMEQAAKKEAAAANLNGGGKAPKGDLTDETLLTLRGAALDAAMEKKWKEMEQASRSGTLSMFRK